MAHTLRFGDEVTLWLDERLPSFVQSEGFVDIRCLLKPSPPPSPHPPSFRGAVFRLRPVASALGALDDMLRALRSKRARYEDETPSETGSDEAPPIEKRPRAASEGLVIPQAKRSRANSDDRAPGLRRRVTCDDLRALEALELLREAAGGAF